MRPMVERILGIALMLAAGLGLVLTILALVMIPRVTHSIQTRTLESLATFDQTLGATGDGLTVIAGSLDNAATTMEAVEATTRDVAVAVEDTKPLFATLSTLAGETLPNTVTTTQQSLDAARDGVRTVEVLLFAIGQVPLLGLPRYDPDVPLNQTLGNVSASLSPLADSFTEIEGSLEVASGNLDQVQGDVAALADALEEIDQTINSAQVVTEDFQAIVERQQGVVQGLTESAGPGITWTSRAIMLLLVWLAIAQLGLFSQGMEMVARSRRL